MKSSWLGVCSAASCCLLVSRVWSYKAHIGELKACDCGGRACMFNSWRLFAPSRDHSSRDFSLIDSYFQCQGSCLSAMQGCIVPSVTCQNISKLACHCFFTGGASYLPHLHTLRTCKLYMQVHTFARVLFVFQSCRLPHCSQLATTHRATEHSEVTRLSLLTLSASAREGHCKFCFSGSSAYQRP